MCVFFFKFTYIRKWIPLHIKTFFCSNRTYLFIGPLVNTYNFQVQAISVLVTEICCYLFMTQYSYRDICCDIHFIYKYISIHQGVWAWRYNCQLTNAVKLLNNLYLVMLFIRTTNYRINKHRKCAINIIIVTLSCFDNYLEFCYTVGLCMVRKNQVQGR